MGIIRTTFTFMMGTICGIYIARTRITTYPTSENSPCKFRRAIANQRTTNTTTSINESSV
ncbi:hypothetical protein ACSBR2_004689 [Camellia fascicularis]